uniref:Uncharacterized protein n=1 Tax=viral metagenome TaxID=1070528 RepID=A0A6M3JNX8_9ZZZZ
MGGISNHKNRERSVSYEIRSIADNIRSKESRGEDASFERKLLESWAGYKGYEKAGEVLASLGKGTSKQA